MEQQFESQMGLASSELTPEINKLLMMRENNKLTQNVAKEWLESLPENERERAKNELETGLMEKIGDLPS